MCIRDRVTAGLSTVGIRMPSHEGALDLIAVSGPIAAPSANRSGRPSPTRLEHVREDLDGKVPVILDGGPCQLGLESTVIDVTGRVPVILRPGAVTREEVAALVGDCQVAQGVLEQVEGCDKKRAVQLTKSDYDRYDYIIAMDEMNIRNIMPVSYTHLVSLFTPDSL